MRLVNMHTASVGNGKLGADYASVVPGAVADFNPQNPSIQLWIKAGLLVPEGAVLASKATALVDGPLMTDLVALRADLVQRDAALADASRQQLARAEEMKRVEDRLSALAGELEAVKAERDHALAAATAPAHAEPARVSRRG